MTTNTNRAFWSDRSRLVAAGAGALLLIAASLYVNERATRGALKGDLFVERSKNLALQHANYVNAQRLLRANGDLLASKGQVALTEHQLRSAQEHESELQVRVDHAASVERDAAARRKELEGLRAEQASMAMRLNEAMAAVDRANGEKLALERTNAGLRADMERMAADQAMLDQSLTQAFKGKRERTTVMAKKTRKLQLSMVLPPSTSKKATYVITTPDGQRVDGSDPAVSVVATPSEGLASVGQGGDSGAEEVKLAYAPKKRLKAGLYRIEVRADGRSLGSTFIALR